MESCKQAKAIELLYNRFPFLARCKGDWAAKYYLKNYTKSHNRRIKERARQEVEPEVFEERHRRRKDREIHRALEAYGQQLNNRKLFVSVSDLSYIISSRGSQLG